MGEDKCHLVKVNHCPTTQNAPLTWCSFISSSDLRITSISKKSAANVPTWAATRCISRKPRDSRCTQNMVPMDGSLGWKRTSMCWLELLDSDCVGGKEEGSWRGQRTDWAVGWRGTSVCALIGRGATYLPTSWISRLPCWKQHLTRVFVWLDLRDWGQTQRYTSVFMV